MKKFFWTAAAALFLPQAAQAAGGAPVFYGQTQAAAYLAFLTAMVLWGWSLCRRVVQRRSRQGLICLMTLLFLWMLLRFSQFTLGFLTQLAHSDWQSYAQMQKILLRAVTGSTWLALALLPSLGLLILWASGQDDDSAPLPPWLKAPLGVSLALWLCQQTQGTPTLLLWWILLSLLGLVCLMYWFCRGLPRHGRLWIPLSVLLVQGLYSWLFFTGGIRWAYLNNFPLAAATLTFLFWEACLRCGALPNNSRYEQLFSLSPLRMEIIDDRGTPAYRSSVTPEADGAVKAQALAEDLRNWPAGQDWRLSSKRIAGGAILWQENVQELNELQASLRRLSERQERENRLLARQNTIRGRMLELQWKNRLYREVEHSIKNKIDEASALLSAIPRKVDDGNRDEVRRTMALVGVVACAVKRKSNLFLTGKQGRQVPLADLMQAMGESARCAKTAGVDCAAACADEGGVSVTAAMLLYDFFEQVLENCVRFSLPSLFARLRRQGSFIELTLLLDCPEGDLESRLIPGPMKDAMTDQGGECSLSRDEDGLRCLCRLPAQPPRDAGKEEAAHEGAF